MARNLIGLSVLLLTTVGCGESNGKNGNNPANDPDVEVTAPTQLECLTNYYGGTPANVSGAWMLRFNDGTEIPWDDGVDRSFEELSWHPERIDLRDMLATPYPTGNIRAPTEEDGDPGYFVPRALLEAVYGDTPAQVEGHLVAVKWMGLPEVLDRVDERITMKNSDAHLMVADVAAADTRKLAEEMRALLDDRPWLHGYVRGDQCCESYHPDGGRFDLRGGPTDHAYGIAVDISKEYGHAWYTDVFPDEFEWKNDVPHAIVYAFEDAGFAWGGRAVHYRTNHFMWRPELFDPDCQL